MQHGLDIGFVVQTRGCMTLLLPVVHMNDFPNNEPQLAKVWKCGTWDRDRRGCRCHSWCCLFRQPHGQGQCGWRGRRSELVSLRMEGVYPGCLKAVLVILARHDGSRGF